MMVTVMLAEQTLAFAYFELFGVFAHNDYSADFTLTEGTEYTVRWDGTEYTRTAFAFTAPDGSLCVGVGNPLASGAESNGDLFCVVYNQSENYLHYLSLEQTETHTVALSCGADVPAVVLKDRDGNQVAYEGVDVVRLLGSDGETRDFVNADDMPEVLENVPVELDFSNGDQTFTAPDGTVVESAVIAKPDTLVPSNIAEGVNIAGIVGSLVAGGGDIVVSSGSILGNNFLSSKAITHGLGVIPDIFIMLPQPTVKISDSNHSSKFVGLIYLSNAFAGKYDLAGSNGSYGYYVWEIANCYVYRRESGQVKVTSTSVTISQTPATSTKYQWIAIGGLT